MDSKDIQIIAQNAGTSAAAIMAAEIRTHNTQWDAERFEEIRTTIFAGVIDAVEASKVAQADIAAAQVQQAFPGAQPVQSAPQPFVPAAQLAPVVPIGTPAAEVAAAVGQAPGYPQPQYAAAPVNGGPPVPPAMAQAAPAPPQAAAGAPAACPACGSHIFDNRADNARRRQLGFKLGTDLKCSNRQCPGGKNGRGWATFPPDFQQYANLPQEPRS